jgi:hypothetical protein
LLQTLIDGVKALEEQRGEREQEGDSMADLDRGKALLHRLISSSNRRMHKGFPEMLSYLLNEPTYYCSHSFVPLSFMGHFRSIQAKFVARGATAEGSVNMRPLKLPNKDKHFLNLLDDYIYRPEELLRLPWYFFVAACEARWEDDALSLPWYEDVDGHRHFIYALGPLVKSTSTLPGVPLKLNGEPLHRYPYFVALRTLTPWQVPMLLGTIISPPKKDASAREKGTYALFVQLLFRPWRGVELPDFVTNVLSTKPPLLTEEQTWEALYQDFLQWREVSIEDVAKPYFRRDAPVLQEPAFNSSEWWACLTAARCCKHSKTLSFCY